MKLLFKFFLIFLISSSFDLNGQTKIELITGLTYPINYSEKNLAREIGFKIGIEAVSNMSKNITINYGLNIYSYLQALPNYRIIDCRTALNNDSTAICYGFYYIDKLTIEKNLSAHFGAELPLLVGTNLTKSYFFQQVLLFALIYSIHVKMVLILTYIPIQNLLT
jgi:hypothetical protein